MRRLFGFLISGFLLLLGLVLKFGPDIVGLPGALDDLEVWRHNWLPSLLARLSQAMSAPALFGLDAASLMIVVAVIALAVLVAPDGIRAWHLLRGASTVPDRRLGNSLTPQPSHPAIDTGATSRPFPVERLATERFNWRADRDRARRMRDTLVALARDELDTAHRNLSALCSILVYDSSISGGVIRRQLTGSALRYVHGFMRDDPLLNQRFIGGTLASPTFLEKVNLDNLEEMIAAYLADYVLYARHVVESRRELEKSTHGRSSYSTWSVAHNRLVERVRNLMRSEDFSIIYRELGIDWSYFIEP